MENNHKQAKRIQTSILNAAEKKALVWMAERMPRWVTSDMMTLLGTIGAFVIMLGYILVGKNLNFLWLASFGFVLNWLGDSLDGTIARVRKQQRPVYGFFLDHNVDCINEFLMFLGAGLSPLMNLSSALLVLASYLILSVYVYIQSHLKGEFKLTYAKLGPTELRLIIIVFNTLLYFVKPLRDISDTYVLFGHEVTLQLLDYIALFLFFAIFILYLISFFKDARQYAAMEPLNKNDDR